MTTKHTPGPWFERKNVSGVYAIVITTAEGTAIATVNRLDLRPGHLREAIPNARLIAAAPDLLEALEDISSAKASDDAFDPFKAAERFQAIARLAIAKAKGE